ncbi:MAG: hypothetical protein JRD89_06890, partial [Deltaproteobacteria bacterium]|nr:hypothetical protein [Deltaproteobacteria bacterium]
MNSYSRIIKARDVKLTDLQDETPTGFVRGLYSPAEDCKEVARQTEGVPAPAEEETAGEDITEREVARKKAEQQEAAEKKACEEAMEGM